MELIVQSPLLPDTQPIHWIQFPKGTWDFASVDNVNRDTEDAALKRIRQQSKLFGSSRFVSLTPLHRRVHSLELYLMKRYPHYQPNDIEREIAERLFMSLQKVKGILLDTSLIYALFISAGMEDMLEI